MPQLPSGRQAALSGDHALALARKGDWGLTMAFTLEAHAPEDLAPLINIIYFKPSEGKNGLGEPYLSGLMLSDLGTEKCDWPEEDVAFFKHWLASDTVKDWLADYFEKLSELVQTVRPPLPENLKGILD